MLSNFDQDFLFLQAIFANLDFWFGLFLFLNGFLGFSGLLEMPDFRIFVEVYEDFLSNTSFGYTYVLFRWFYKELKNTLLFQ